MDSAVGSGCEPEYGGMDGGSESPQGQGLSGFPERGGLFAGDRDTGDDEPVTRGAEAGDRTPEQQAADILLQATEGLEPDYEFESVGDGRDEQSPERENSAQRAPLPLNQGRARGPTRLADEASVNGVMPGVQGQRVAAESGSRSGRGLDLGSNVPLQGMSRGTLDHQSGQQGHIPAGERRQRSGRGSDVEPGFPMQALFREQLEQQTSQHERVELLERLVYQLMDQNELLRREAVDVKLAYGQCSLLVNRAGILLSREYVAPIVSVKAILSLGYKMEWNNSRCRVWHPTEGELPVDVQTGCPEIPEECALALIDRYEQLVLKSEGLKARMCCLMRDMTGLSVKELAHLVVRRDAQGDAALKMLVESVFKDTPTDLVDQVVASVQDQVSETFTWNRRMRRRFERSEGLVLHLFCGEGRRAFDKVAEKNGMVHVPVETGEDLLADETYQFLLRQAARGRIKALICSPPSRTFAPCRYAVNQGDGVIRPIRVRGESLGEYGVDGLNGQELACTVSLCS
eukprot:s8414_g2.t1